MDAHLRAVRAEGLEDLGPKAAVDGGYCLDAAGMQGGEIYVVPVI